MRKRLLLFLGTSLGMAVLAAVVVGALNGNLDVGSRGAGTAWMTIFLVLPAGLGAGATLLVPVPTRKIFFLAWAGTSVLLCCAFLIALGFEGVVCCLMALPLVSISFLAGAAAGRLLMRFLRAEPGALRAVSVLVLLASLPASVHVEHRMSGGPRVEAVTTAVFVAAPPATVWSSIESVDAIRGPRPFLLRIGLPVPRTCRLEGRAVGARRTCTFDRGRIEEVIRTWDPPRRMDLDIVAVTVPGRHWLGYRSASYELTPRDGGTDLVRTTTIISQLRPAWYWRPLERLGVASEHHYLLDDVRRRFEP